MNSRINPKLNYLNSYGLEQTVTTKNRKFMSKKVTSRYTQNFENSYSCLAKNFYIEQNRSLQKQSITTSINKITDSKGLLNKKSKKLCLFSPVIHFMMFCMTIFSSHFQIFQLCMNNVKLCLN